MSARPKFPHERHAQRHRPGERAARGGRRAGAARAGERRAPPRHAGRRPRRDRARGQARAVVARRLPHGRCQGRGALRRQGEEHQEAGDRLYAADRARQPHRAHDLRHGGDGIRHHQDRDRSAALGSQFDQAAASALQRAAARRQVVPLHPDHVRPLGPADPQASRRAHAGGALLWALRQCRRGQPHHQRAAARVPAALLFGFVFRGAHAAVPALSDQALLGALHAGDRFRRLWRAGARSQRFLVRPQPAGAEGDGGGNGHGVGGARFRTRRGLSRSSSGAVGDHVASGHQPPHARGGRRVRRASGRRLHVCRGVLLPHRAELGQPRLFPQGRPRSRRQAKC